MFTDCDMDLQLFLAHGDTRDKFQGIKGAHRSPLELMEQQSPSRIMIEVIPSHKNVAEVCQYSQENR